MRINADFTKAAVVMPDAHRWVPSPQGGVARVMLDRVGGERARATSLVRYDQGSRFPAHEHPGGEEILVLDGVFSDAEQDFPAGWYLRNPPGSVHQPFSDDGAVIFAKLWQMEGAEAGPVRTDTRDPANWRRNGGREQCALFDNGQECVRMERLLPGQRLTLDATSGAELLVVDGELANDVGRFPARSWIRTPASSWVELEAGKATTVFIKTGHLPTPEQVSRFEQGLQTP